MGRLDGKVALISGVARGQGRSHAIRLAEEGADIIGFDVLEPIAGAPYGPATEEDLAETVKAVEALDRRIIAKKADVRKWEQVKAVTDEGVAEFGRLDIVLGNAGIFTSPNTAENITDEEFVDMVEVNLTGVWRTVKAAIPHMKAAGNGGSIVLTSSTAGLNGFPNFAHYVSAKHGVVGLMRTLALELGPEMIRVNSVHPTGVATDMILNDGMYKLFRPDLENPGLEDFKPVMQSMNLLPTVWLEPVDISNAIVFLCSDEARYITGVTLPVDAGQTVK
jgi:SDR family mycofactocin-dependent oxidoreductase